VVVVLLLVVQLAVVGAVDHASVTVVVTPKTARIPQITLTITILLLIPIIIPLLLLPPLTLEG
jgi:hypothetical protein